jgi:23S rRNA-/tRNA-specific pseudouridylate synthase
MRVLVQFCWLVSSKPGLIASSAGVPRKLDVTERFRGPRKVSASDDRSFALSMSSQVGHPVPEPGLTTCLPSRWQVKHTIFVREGNPLGKSREVPGDSLGLSVESTLLELECVDASQTYLAETPELRQALEIERGHLATDIESHFTSQWEWSGAKHLHAGGAHRASANADTDKPWRKQDELSRWLERSPRLLFEDTNWIAFSKPAGVLSSTVLYMAMKQKTADERQNAQQWRLVHRLDRDTSGILMFGKTSAANQLWNALTCQRRGGVEKLYVAELHQKRSMSATSPCETLQQLQAGDVIRIVSGHGTTTRGLQRLYPLELVGQRLHPRMRHPVRLAETRFFIVSRTSCNFCKTAAPNASEGSHQILRVMCAPITGRTHQVRLHAHAMGMPVFGDVRYGVLFDARYTPFHHLHAVSLTLKKPDDEFISIKDEAPEWWQHSFSLDPQAS